VDAPFVLRLTLVAVVAVAGVVLLALGGATDQAVGGGLLGVAPMIALASWLARLSVNSEQDREAEARARENPIED
jgi:hypothetical protein